MKEAGEMAKNLSEDYDIWRLCKDVIAEYDCGFIECDNDGFYYTGPHPDGNVLDIRNDEHVLILAELAGYDLEKYRFDDYNQKSE